jgi:hypothetical protein
MIQVVIDTKALKRHARRLDKIKGGAPKAITSALARTMRSGKTEVSKQARAIYLIKKGNLDATIATRHAGMRAEVRSKHTGMLPLYDFKVTPRRLDPRKRRTLHATVKKGGGGPLGRAFIGFFYSGHVGVFARATNKRLPIRELRAISAPIMISQEPVAEPAMEKMNEVFQKRIDHEINRLLAK